MLTDAKVHPSIATSDLERAKAWYAEKIGWVPVRKVPGMLIYSVDGSTFTVYETPSAGTAKNTVAIWRVDDLRKEVARLRARGLQFEDYDFDDLKTVDGIATDESGILNAWFKDADGNYVSMVEQHPEPGEEPAEPGVGAMIGASDLARARAWYIEKLGLTPYRDYEGELVIFRTGATRFSVYETPSAGTAQNTVAMWWVKDLRAEVAELRGRGVVFEEYDFGEARTIDGILEDDDGMVAWFKDSEGNILGVGQYSQEITGSAA
jgi:catechol 2,3-dioxygenase-like lactoylglutathione lyase family enzyme